MTFVVTTGATGRLGGRIAARLAAAGAEQRLVSRHATHMPPLKGATAVSADYGDPEAMRRALDGAATVLFVSASESSDRLDRHRSFVDAAADARIGHLVYISFYGAAPDATFTLARDHWATEQHIRDSGLSFTFLRDNLYADFLPSMAGDDGVIRGPAGQGRVAAVTQDDIADAATAVLLDPAAHEGATYDLTGPQALTLDEVAATLMQLEHDFQLIVLAGRNEAALTKLKVHAVEHPGRLFPFGFTNEVAQLMACSDLVITKPGGLTTSECLAMGVPMVVYAPVPGQEERNADYVLEQGAALKAIDLVSLEYRIRQLLAEPQRLARMREHARRLGQPQAARRVLEIVQAQLAGKSSATVPVDH